MAGKGLREAPDHSENSPGKPQLRRGPCGSENSGGQACLRAVSQWPRNSAAWRARTTGMSGRSQAMYAVREASSSQT